MEQPQQQPQHQHQQQQQQPGGWGALVAQAPVLRDWRRNVASTVVILTVGTLLIAGGADWSYRSIRSWAHNRVNTNITLPLTHWQLEVRVRWVKAAPIIPTNINELFEAHPLKTKLYAVGLLCSPRWALLWAWLFDRDPGLRLLQLHFAQHQAHVLDSIKRLVHAVVPDILPSFVLDAAAADDSPISRLAALLSKLDGASLFWWAWLLCPGLQTAYIMLFFAQRSPIKVVYASVIGIARTGVELSALAKCCQALARRNTRAVVNSLLCCYLLPFIMTLQSLAVLLLLGVAFPYWIVHICVVAFCLWGPPVMIALMTTAWQPERQRVAGADAPAGVAAADGGGGGVGAVDAMAALVGAGPRAPGGRAGQLGDAGGGGWGRRAGSTQEAVHWPKPLQVPEAVEEACSVPHFFICPITHSIMLEPAVTSSGATYERAAIMEWLRAQKRDPLTSRELRPEQVSPNLALYRAIEEWIESCKALLDKQQQQQQGVAKAGVQDKERDKEKERGRRRSIGGRRCSSDRRSSTDTACLPETAVDQAGRPQQPQQQPAAAAPESPQ
uniref:U-box domain-containing protein n=1 Tax=Tetradesmus obliquus TaxID=3088 RepID=A0A383VPS3_TETOB|eukprot:jgi/Sobl393_1/10770/SZX67181.1